MTGPKWQVGKSYRTVGGHRAEIWQVISKRLGSVEFFQYKVEHYGSVGRPDVMNHNENGTITGMHFPYFDLTTTEWEG